LQAAFDSAADIPAGVFAQLGDHLGEAVHTPRAGGDSIPAGGVVDRHDGNTQFCRDVSVGALPVQVLLAQPVLVNVLRWR